MTESKELFSSLYGSQVVTSQKVFRIVTPLISAVLVLAGLGLAAAIIVFRSKQLSNLPEDILLGALAALLVTAGIAFSALANGLLTRLLLEVVKLDQETLSRQVLKMQQKLVDAVGDRLKTLELPTSLTVTQREKTGSLSVVFKDSSGTIFEPGKDIPVLTWASDHPEIAKVGDDGVVTWVKAGNADITASFRTIKSGPCTVTCS